MKKTIKTVFFNIPNTLLFPDEYRGGSVEVGVWPSIGVLPFVLDREDGLERLEDWAINNVLRGFVEGYYTEAYLREEEDLIKVTNRDGEILLDTFIHGYDYGRYLPGGL